MIPRILCVLLTGLFLACGGIVRPRSSAPDDPYPECRAVRAYLQANLPIADGYEVIEWGDGVKQPTVPGGRGPALSLKYRYRNQQGGWTVIRKEFYFTEDRGSVRGWAYMDGFVGPDP